jgi:hypothetical protein
MPMPARSVHSIIVKLASGCYHFRGEVVARTPGPALERTGSFSGMPASLARVQRSPTATRTKIDQNYVALTIQME